MEVYIHVLVEVYVRVLVEVYLGVLVEMNVRVHIDHRKARENEIKHTATAFSRKIFCILLHNGQFQTQR